MPKEVRIWKGFDIPLQGSADKIYGNASAAETFVINPGDFKWIVPKLLVQQGAEVKAGDPLFYEKSNEKILFTAPVSGEVIEINRGEKRKLLEIKILADKEIKYKAFPKSSPDALSKEEIISRLLESGTWPFIRQRPYGIIANPDDTPKSIFISAFDTAPLAPDNDFIVHGHGQEFQAGLDALAKLTTGKVHLNVLPDHSVSGVFYNSKNVQINKVSGPHPAGNVGVQIHHIDPIKKGEVVWYLYPQDVLAIGRLFIEGRYNVSRVIAVTGSEVKHPKYFKTIIGTSVKPFLADNLKEGKIRCISGNVLTGQKIPADGYLGFYDSQITAIPEGDEPEFMGWLAPGFDKLSLSGTFLSWLMPGKKYKVNTNFHGEERPFVVTGQYEKVFPMDIYPVHLLKAIIVKDLDMMEQLGIYEVAEEDFALCEFACTSKINAQEIIREGLEMMYKESHVAASH